MSDAFLVPLPSYRKKWSFLRSDQNASQSQSKQEEKRERERESNLARVTTPLIAGRLRSSGGSAL
jgi:hypothetical protein